MGDVNSPSKPAPVARVRSTRSLSAKRSLSRNNESNDGSKSFCTLIFKTLHYFLFIFVAIHVIRVFGIPSIAKGLKYYRFISTDAVLGKMGLKVREFCTLPRNVKNCEVNERIHLILISASWEKEPISELETEISLKSIMASTKCKLFFHFLTIGEYEEWKISKMMEAVDAIPFDMFGPIDSDLGKFKNVNNSTYRFDLDSEDSRIKEASVLYSITNIPVVWIREQARKIKINIKHHSGEAGFAKLFIPQIFSSLKRVIYLDIDIIFAEDIGQLWKHFDEMDKNENLMLFMGDNNPVHPGPRSLYPLCSCQLLMDLNKLRKLNITQTINTILGKTKATKVHGFRPGDQWIWTLICMDDPKRCKKLSKLWNVSGCASPRFLGLRPNHHAPDGSCWKAVHFNCVSQSNGHYRSLKDWANVVRYVKSIKWRDLKNK